MIDNDEHLTKEGITQILKLRNTMNDGGKRKYSDEEILKSFDVSSETIRQISERETFRE